MIVEKISGVPLEAYFQQHIFEPLGMVDTSYAVPLAKQSRVATKHTRMSGLLQEQPRRPIPATPTVPFRGDGGLYSTAQDYGKFMQMLLNGRQSGARENPERELGKDDGREQHRFHLRGVAACRRPIARQTVSARLRPR